MEMTTGTQEREFMWSSNLGKRSGFTLIELLVTTALSLLLIGGAIAAFSSLSVRQSRAEAAKDVINLLYFAQNRSQAGDKPQADCGTLDGYRVYGFVNTQQYYIVPRCDGEDLVEERVTHLLREQEHFLSDFSFIYPTQPGPVTGAPDEVQISRLDDTNNPYIFSVTGSGIVEDQGIVEQ